MSHSLVLVILPLAYVKDYGVEECVDNALEPFNENKPVEEYDDDCSCAKWALSAEAVKYAIEMAGFSYDDLRAMYVHHPKYTIEREKQARNGGVYHKKEEELDTFDKYLLNLVELERKANHAIWTKMRQPLERFEEEYKVKNGRYFVPDPKCANCHGTGKFKTTYNPDSRWDWYEIGGRWNGAVQGKDLPGGTHARVENIPIPDPIANNVIAMDKLDKDFTCFAIVTPDGEWHERGHMGWWGIVADDKEYAWCDEFKEIIEPYRTEEYVGIGVDVHI